ncbi:hypothetical protein LSH36_2520g00005 [Paralvinella palmiformis]|uniref:Uncharacterized protein n=1 Tax=Paralvinella palmiformis TaxID=53620 RepID=A0AAD9MKB8_9ANNE|nr:hypothetical protein LSH36_2520g00005 [Paralvinella palmiformis]
MMATRSKRAGPGACGRSTPFVRWVGRPGAARCDREAQRTTRAAADVVVERRRAVRASPVVARLACLCFFCVFESVTAERRRGSFALVCATKGRHIEHRFLERILRSRSLPRPRLSQGRWTFIACASASWRSVSIAVSEGVACASSQVLRVRLRCSLLLMSASVTRRLPRTFVGTGVSVSTVPQFGVSYGVCRATTFLFSDSIVHLNSGTTANLTYHKRRKETNQIPPVTRVKREEPSAESPALSAAEMWRLRRPMRFGPASESS